MGKSKRPLTKDTVYLHQTRSWSDARTFGMWFHGFLRFVRRFTSKPVLVLMDNHSNNANVSDPNGQVTVMEYPPYCTSKNRNQRTKGLFTHGRSATRRCFGQYVSTPWQRPGSYDDRRKSKK